MLKKHYNWGHLSEHEATDVWHYMQEKEHYITQVVCTSDPEIFMSWMLKTFSSKDVGLPEDLKARSEGRRRVHWEKKRLQVFTEDKLFPTPEFDSFQATLGWDIKSKHIYWHQSDRQLKVYIPDEARVGLITSEFSLTFPSVE